MQVLRVHNRVRILNPHIYSGKKVPEINRKEIRELIEGSYRIIYKVIDQNRVDILTVHHSARDLGKRNLSFKK